MRWAISDRFDPPSVALADRHYSRQQPGTPQFTPPAPQIVLRTPDSKAVWVTTWPRYARHAWLGAWICVIFRNEGAGLSSELIREAVAATRWHFGEPPLLGMITFVDENAIRRKRDPGRCFLKAGFVRLAERTKVRKRIVLQMMPDVMPPADAPLGTHATKLFTSL